MNADDIENLTTAIDAAVHTNRSTGPMPGKTTAAGLSAVLKRMVNELGNQSEATGPPQALDLGQATAGEDVHPGSGYANPNADYTRSDFAAVTPGTVYTASVGFSNAAYYDTDFNYLASWADGASTTSTAPTGAAYLRLSVPTGSYPDVTVTYPASTYYVLPPATSKGRGGVKVGAGLDVARDGTLSLTPALLDLGTGTAAQYIDGNSGEASAGGGDFTASDYLAVTAGTVYTVNAGIRSAAYYDADLHFLAPWNADGSGSYTNASTAPAGAAFLRVSVPTPAYAGLQITYPPNPQGNQRAVASPAEALSGTHLAAWGDSLTSGLGEVPYSIALEKLTGFSIYNGGVGGDTSVQTKDRMLAATDKHAWPTIIWTGRNDSGQPDQVKASISAMVAALGHENYLVLSVLNAANEGQGTDGYAKVLALNAVLAATYGAHYLDVRAFLVAQAGSSDDNLPPSLRKAGDTLHLNAEGYALVARCINGQLAQLLGPNMAKLLSVRAALSLLKSPTLLGKVTQIGSDDNENLLELRAANGNLIAFAGAGNALSTTGNFYVDGGNGLILQAGGSTALEITPAAIYPKVQIVSPALVGTPSAPTADPGTDTAQVATTAFVSEAVRTLGAQGPDGTFAQLSGQPNENPALAAALASKANVDDARLLGLGQLVNNLAVRISSNAARTRTYYTGAGTQAANNADDGLIRALADAAPGETVQVTTPLIFPYADYFAAVLKLPPGVILDMGGFDLTSAYSQDGLGFSAGSYTVYGRDATIYSKGQGSCGLTWPEGANPTVKAYDLHLVNSGSASAALMRSGSVFQRGSVEVDSVYQSTGINLYSQAARYELVGDVTVRQGCAGFEVAGGCVGLVRQGHYVVTTATGQAARIYDGGQLELMQCVVDLTAGPTTAGFRLQTANSALILTDVTVLGGSIVAYSNQGRVTLRGSTVLPAAYNADYLRGLGVTVVDERAGSESVATGTSGVAHRSSTLLTFEQDAEYDPIATGTFTVDDSTKRIGAVVVAYLTPNATAPTLPGPKFQSKDAYVAGRNLMYLFKVGANGSIQYTITTLD